MMRCEPKHPTKECHFCAVNVAGLDKNTDLSIIPTFISLFSRVRYSDDLPISFLHLTLLKLVSNVEYDTYVNQRHNGNYSDYAFETLPVSFNTERIFDVLDIRKFN